MRSINLNCFCFEIIILNDFQVSHLNDDNTTTHSIKIYVVFCRPVNGFVCLPDVYKQEYSEQYGQILITFSGLSGIVNDMMVRIS